MSDLVKTLREQAIHDNEDYYSEDYRTQAAGLIESQQTRIDELSATVERLREALDIIRQIANHPPKNKAILQKALYALGEVQVESLQLLTEQERKRAYVVGFTDASDWHGAEMSLQFITDEAAQQYAKRQGGE